MKILLDECLPRKLGSLLTNHEVRTAPQMGWASLKNGQLLSRVEEQFNVFITIDSNFELSAKYWAFQNWSCSNQVSLKAAQFSDYQKETMALDSDKFFGAGSFLIETSPLSTT